MKTAIGCGNPTLVYSPPTLTFARRGRDVGVDALLCAPLRHQCASFGAAGNLQSAQVTPSPRSEGRRRQVRLRLRLVYEIRAPSVIPDASLTSVPSG